MELKLRILILSMGVLLIVYMLQDCQCVDFLHNPHNVMMGEYSTLIDRILRKMLANIEEFYEYCIW